MLMYPVACQLVMTRDYYFSGLEIIYTLDEVAFIQNLIFYIESAYRIAVSTKLMFVLNIVQVWVQSTVIRMIWDSNHLQISFFLQQSDMIQIICN